jgi:hypothetical protein
MAGDLTSHHAQLSGEKMKKACLLIMTSLVLGLPGCGGDGGDDSSTVPEGVYEGLTSVNEYFNLLVLENGLYYSMNGTVSGGIFDVDSLSTGTGSSSNGRFASADFKQFFGNSTSASGSLNARFNNWGGDFSGSLTSGSSSATFSGDKVDSSVHDYKQAASLGSVTGAWNNLRALDGSPVRLAVAGNGSFTGTVSGACIITGQFTRRASGKNVFDVTPTFGAAPCVPASQSISGHAVEFDLGTGTQQLAIAGTDASRNNGTLLLGLR